MIEQKLKVLVVDDDRRMVMTICGVLNIKGYEPITAYSGEEAVERVKSHAPDCVLMDIKMPGINGVDALKMMKELSPDLPVVLMSAYASEEVEAEADRIGADAVLTKPIDLQKMLAFLSLLKKEESVLIVDDDPEFAQSMKQILSLNGYKVSTEADPGSALEIMKQDYKLLVLLDLKLGNLDGLDVLKEIRAKYPSKPVVLVTGYSEEMNDSIKKGLQIGAHACLYKPLEIEKLVGLIEDVSRKKARAVLEDI